MAAAFKDRISLITLVALALSVALPKTRSMDPARMPIITITINSSTSVKPRAFLFLTHVFICKTPFEVSIL
jgi:hypothetical protein